MENEKQIDEMIKITIDTQVFEVSPMIYHFIKLLKCRNEESIDFRLLISEFQSFLEYWDDFKQSKKDSTYNNKHLQRFNLFHTIKPKTKYAHQQEKKNGKNLLYPVYRIVNGTVYSMGVGGNYPIKDCVFYLGDGSSIEILK